MTAHLILSLRIWAILLLALAFDPLRCSRPTTEAIAAELPPSIVITEGKTAQRFLYLSGGVGADERAALEERGKAFNVKLVFAEQHGPFLADVKVAIDDGKGTEIVSLTSVGPWFYIQLPPGPYNVNATYKGQTQEIRNLQVAKDKALRRTLTWNLAEE
jgi:hypothetical protein